MKKYVTVFFVAAVALMFLLCGCSGSSAEQGELQLDARVTEVPVESTEAVQIAAEEAETEEPSASEPATENIAASAESETTYAEALCAAFAETGAIDTFAPYSDIDILDYYGIDVSQCISAAAYVDTEGYACELVIVEAEETLAKEIEALLSGYLDARYSQFESYDADAAQLVKNAVMRRDGGIVLMIVSPQADELLSIYRSFEI